MVVFTAKSLKFGPTDSQKIEVLEQVCGPHAGLLPRELLDMIYRKTIRSTDTYQETKGRLEAAKIMQGFLAKSMQVAPKSVAERFKNKEVVKLFKQVSKSVHRRQVELDGYNTLRTVVGSNSNQLISSLYTIGNRLEQLATGGSAGIYRHFTRHANALILEALHKKTGFGNHSVFVDFGSGLGIPGMHAAVKYGCKSISLECEAQFCNLGAVLFIQMYHNFKKFNVNPRVASVQADFTKVTPLSTGTHAFLFDLVFSPGDYYCLLHLLAKSQFKYVVTFKPLRHGSYLPDVLDILDAKVIGKVGPLSFHGSTESATALVLERKTTPAKIEWEFSDASSTSESVSEESTVDWLQEVMIDSECLAEPFLTGDLDGNLARYTNIKHGIEEALF